MKSIMGSTRVESNHSEFTELGKRLTAEAGKRLPGKCICCGNVDGPIFLMHWSVDTGELLSFTVCNGCTKQVAVFELFAIVIQRTLEGVERKRSALQ